jgi:hypothetical protein
MKKIILAIASLTVLVGQAFAAGVLINGSQINPQTAISISTLTVTGKTGLTATSSVTAGGFYGAGAGLTGTAASLTAGNVTTNANLTGDVTSSGNATTAVKASGAFTMTSTATVQGNAFSVGGSTLVVSGGKVGIGTTSPISTGTLTVNGGISILGANRLDTGTYEQKQTTCSSATSCTTNCSSGKQVLGGGCNTNGSMGVSYPNAGSWNCGTTASATIIAWAICANFN